MKFRTSSVRHGVFWILAGVVVSWVVLGGCDKKDPVEPKQSPPAPVTVCVPWTGQATGIRYNYPNNIIDNGIVMVLERFYPLSGDSTEGFVEFFNSQTAGGSGVEAFVGNVNVNFAFTFPCTKITLKFFDGGGDENLRVNGQLAKVNSLTSLHGTTLGGVNVSVTGVSPAVLTLEGNITNFRIGGQEFLIDDICSTRPGS